MSPETREILTVALLLLFVCGGGVYWREIWALLPYVAVTLLWWAALRAVVGRLTVAWQVGELGVRRVRRWHPAVVYPWSSIRRLDEEPGWLVLETTRGTFRIPRTWMHADELARRIRRRLDTPAPATAELDPAQIATWLGIPEDGALTMKARGPGCGLVFVASYGAVAFAMSWTIGFQFTGPVLGPPVLLLLLSLLRQREGDLTVTATGLRSGGKHLADWADVRQLSLHHDWYTIHTDRGDIRYYGHASGADKLTRTVRQVLAAREAGAALPRMGAVPDTALSRATPDEASAERGLSRPE